MQKYMRFLLAVLAFMLFSWVEFPALAGEVPQYETRKLTDNVYIFRYLGAQSMFVVTQDGVIATDPLNPKAAAIYLQEIRKIASTPVRYVVYSHHHFDHISGGAPFKEAGATFVAHRRAREHLLNLKNPDVVIPDLVVDDQGTALTLGGTRLELHYVGRNHSDNSLAMFLPKEKIVFAVDFLPVQGLPFRAMPDSSIRGWFQSIDRVLQLDWDKLVPGHPSRQGPTGTKDDVRALKEYLTDLSNAVRQAAAEGKCFDQAMKDIKLPKYEKWGNYNEYLPGNIERLCYYWRNGWE